MESETINVEEHQRKTKIVRSIYQGSDTFEEIHDDTGIEIERLKRSLEDLVREGAVDVEVPDGSENSKIKKLAEKFKSSVKNGLSGQANSKSDFEGSSENSVEPSSEDWKKVINSRDAESPGQI